MKVNDIVVLKNGLNSFYLVLEMEKHLFEIVKIVHNGDVAMLKSLSTGVEVAVELESIRLATLKERYLVDGNVVNYNGELHLVVNNSLIPRHGNSYDVNYFDDNLINVGSKIKIKAIYELKIPFALNLFYNINELTLLWQRSIELTDDEKVILRNLKVVNDGISKYISRNKNNKLFLRENKDDNYVLPLSNFNHLFKSITHESGVHEIKELLK